ncbi:MAG: hypothetical protein ABIO79_08560 [Ferruginibacter sp.]
MDYYPPLLADNIYHITGHAVGREKLFLSDDNYRFFLKRYNKYIIPIADTFTYSLLPNHFHFLLQIKSYGELGKYYKKIKPHGKKDENWQPDFVMQQFSNMFNSYAKAFNKKNNRRGALFMDYMRRLEVTTDGQYTATVFYIHKNIVHHGYCKDILSWPWSSYHAIVSNANTKVERQKVLEWFGSREKFIEYHLQPISLKNAVIVEYENQ